MLFVRFYRAESGNEPVREWLRGLDAQDRKAIGEDIKTVELGWPLGMPLVRKMETDLWEIRIGLPQRIARVSFTVVASEMVLLHGLIKKAQHTPLADLKLVRARMRQVRGALGARS